MNPFGACIVIPVLNEETTIRDLVASVLTQTRPADEVLIVDGGSTDRTCAIVEELSDRGPVRLIRAGRAYPGEGRNLGAREAAHEVVAFTDAGVRLDDRWLEELCRPLEQDPSIEVVYGTYEPVLDSFFKECAALAFVPAPIFRQGQRIRGPSVASCLIRKSVWKSVGGFPPYRAAEDLIFMDALERRGCSIAYASRAVAHWHIVPGWRAMFGRFATYSEHNLRAGWGRYWHLGVAKMYAAAALIALLAVTHSIWWLIVPMGGFAARVWLTAFRKRAAFGFTDVFRLKRLLYLAGLLLMMDGATMWGALRWVTGGSEKRA